MKSKQLPSSRSEVDAANKPYAIIPQVELTDECWAVGGDECPFAYWEIDVDEQSYVGCRHKSNCCEQVFEPKHPVDEYATPKGQDAIEAEVRTAFKKHISRTCPYRVR